MKISNRVCIYASEIELLVKADGTNVFDITPSTGKTVEDCPNVGVKTENYEEIFFLCMPEFGNYAGKCRHASALCGY